jgi:hypothetical protein
MRASQRDDDCSAEKVYLPVGTGSWRAVEPGQESGSGAQPEVTPLRWKMSIALLPGI